jgi:hypothetical protein
MSRRTAITAATLFSAIVLFGLFAIYSDQDRQASRLVLRAKKLESVITESLKACFNNPTPENVNRFGKAVTQMGEIISAHGYPSDLRKAMELELGEVIGTAHGIAGWHNTALAGLSSGLAASAPQ